MAVVRAETRGAGVERGRRRRGVSRKGGRGGESERGGGKKARGIGMHGHRCRRAARPGSVSSGGWSVRGGFTQQRALPHGCLLLPWPCASSLDEWPLRASLVLRCARRTFGLAPHDLCATDLGVCLSRFFPSLSLALVYDCVMDVARAAMASVNEGQGRGGARRGGAGGARRARNQGPSGGVSVPMNPFVAVSTVVGRDYTEEQIRGALATCKNSPDEAVQFLLETARPQVVGGWEQVKKKEPRGVDHSNQPGGFAGRGRGRRS